MMIAIIISAARPTARIIEQQLRGGYERKEDDDGGINAFVLQEIARKGVIIDDRTRIDDPKKKKRHKRGIVRTNNKQTR